MVARRGRRSGQARSPRPASPRRRRLRPSGPAEAPEDTEKPEPEQSEKVETEEDNPQATAAEKVETAAKETSPEEAGEGEAEEREEAETNFQAAEAKHPEDETTPACPHSQEAEMAHGHGVVPPPPRFDGEWAHHQHGDWAHGHEDCSAGCCVEVPGTSELSRLRINSHCNFKGHCVQLKHTFIHVDCANSDSEEEDCMLCNLTRRRRARSADSREPTAISSADLDAGMEERILEIHQRRQQRRALGSSSFSHHTNGHGHGHGHGHEHSHVEPISENLQ